MHRRKNGPLDNTEEDRFTVKQFRNIITLFEAFLSLLSE